MPPRLAHKKSRNGCQRCKARRVKCDEAHPVCGHCARHRVPCEFVSGGSGSRSPSVSRNGEGGRSAITSSYSPKSPGSTPRSAQSRTHQTPQQHTSSAKQQRTGTLYFDPTSPYSSELDTLESAFDAEERRLLELRLLHWFTTSVTESFPSYEAASLRDVWNVHAIQIALEHPFLLNGIFAISALHLASGNHQDNNTFSPQSPDRISVARILNPPPASIGVADLAKAHRIYLNLAIQQQREAVANLSAKNANAIFLSTVLLNYQVLRSLPDESSRESYEPPVQWLRMSRSIITVGYFARPLVKHSAVLDLMQHIQEAPNVKDCAAIIGSHNYLGNPIFEPLLDWERFPESNFTPETRAAYERLLGYVGGVHRYILEKENPRILFRRILMLGPFCPKPVHEFLIQRRPRALVMMAYHFAMAKEVEDHWIVRDAAEREVYGVQGLLPPEWQWAMEWPLRILKVGVHEATREFMVARDPTYEGISVPSRPYGAPSPELVG